MKCSVLGILAMAMASALHPTIATAQSVNWPDRPVKFIVPFAPGSTVDNVSRIVADALSPRIGKPVVIENRPGASGTLGLAALAASPPDGYTFGMGTTSNVAVAVGATPKLSYNPTRDFASVGMVGSGPYILAVNSGLPVQNVQELVALAKQKPGEIKYGSVGLSSLANLSTLLFANSMGIKLTHVPYRAAAQVSLDAIAGLIDMQFSTLGSTLPYSQATGGEGTSSPPETKGELGRLRILGVSSAKRVPELPDTPTLAEAGVPGYESVLWIALFAPARTPDAVIARMNSGLHAILQEPQVIKALTDQGIAAEALSPAQLAERVTSDVKKWTEVVTKAGIKEE